MLRKTLATLTFAAGAMIGTQFVASTTAQANGVFIQRQCERYANFCGGLGTYQAAREYYDALGRPLVSKKPRRYGRRNGTSPLKPRRSRRSLRRY